jgi:acetyltransferase-like isoleucine patch superfamily enzyme
MPNSFTKRPGAHFFMISGFLLRWRGFYFKMITNCSYLTQRRKISWSTIIRKAENSSIGLGKGSRIVEHGKIVLQPGSRLRIGNNTSIDRLCEIIVEADSELTIGDNVFVGSHSNIRVTGKMSIGNNCRIAQFVSLINGNYGFMDRSLLIKDQPYQKGFLFVNDDVWIGVSATILPNVVIGTGAVIGAGAVVAKDVDEYSVIVGNPQKLIKVRQ